MTAPFLRLSAKRLKSACSSRPTEPRLYALVKVHGLRPSNARPVRVDDSDVVRPGQLVERRVTKARTHQCTAEQHDCIALCIAVVCVRNSKRGMPACMRVWWKNVALVEADVAEKIKDRHSVRGERRGLTGRAADDVSATR